MLPTSPKSSKGFVAFFGQLHPPTNRAPSPTTFNYPHDDPIALLTYNTSFWDALPCQSKVVFRSKKVLKNVLTFTAAGQLFPQKKEYIYI
jgi:hypothetical protein